MVSDQFSNFFEKTGTSSPSFRIFTLFRRCTSFAPSALVRALHNVPGYGVSTGAYREGYEMPEGH